MRRGDDGLRFYRLLRDFLHKSLAVQRRCSPVTVRNYTDSLNRFRLYLRDERGVPFDRVDFGCFSRQVVYDFCVWLRDERALSPSTVNLRLSAIKSFLRYCGEEDPSLGCHYLEVRTIHRFKGRPEQRLEYLTPAQLAALFARPDTATRLGRRNQYIMIHAYETGCRNEELVGMTLGDVVRNDGNVQARIHGKGDKVRYVPFAEDAVPHLDAYLAEFHPDGRNGDPLFYTVHGGERTRMSQRTVNAFLARYAAELHAEDPSFPASVHCHVLRHSIGMAMFKAGIPLPYIQDFLGHASIQSTQIYAHADAESLREALEAVGHELLPDREPRAGSPARNGGKRWKGREQYLLEYCGLG